MERTPGVFTRRWRPEKIQKTVHSPSVTEELHVLAVDDSLIDRKVIERLLKISSCKVTAVDSGWSAVQYLWIDGDKSGSVGLDGLKVNLIITDYCFLNGEDESVRLNFGQTWSCPPKFER